MNKAYVVAATFGDSEGAAQIMGLCAAPSSEVAVSWFILQAVHDGKANDPLMAVNSLEVTAEQLRTLLREIEEPSAGPKVVSLSPKREHNWRPVGLGNHQCVDCGLYYSPLDDRSAPCRGTRDLPPAGE